MLTSKRQSFESKRLFNATFDRLLQAVKSPSGHVLSTCDIFQYASINMIERAGFCIRRRFHYSYAVDLIDK